MLRWPAHVLCHVGQLCSICLLSVQLGIPHSFALISYQHKFQDDDQTRVKGSLK